MLDLIKKILLIGAISLIAFPIIYLSIMFAEGQLRIEKGPKQVDSDRVEILKYDPIADSLSAVYSKAFESMVQQQERLEREKRILAKQEERLNLADRELVKKKKKIDEDKRKIESIVKSSSKLEEKRIKALAKIYGSMRADEAAPILETLPDKLIISILRNINEDRQKAKILEKMDRQRAGIISEKMGKIALSKKKG